MDSAEALETIWRAATAYRIQYRSHARQWMQERGITPGDVRSALIETHDCQENDDERRKVTGQDLEGNELTVVLVIEGDLVIITVF